MKKLASLAIGASMVVAAAFAADLPPGAIITLLPGGGASVTVPPSTINIVAVPATIERGNSATLSWLGENVANCVASGGWTGPKVVPGSETVSPTETTSYGMLCDKPDGTKLTAAPATVTVTVPPVVPAITSLQVTPTTVTIPGKVTMTWQTQGMANCIAYGDSAIGQTALPVNGSIEDAPTKTPYVWYGIGCTGTDGKLYGLPLIKVIVNAPPIVANAITDQNALEGTAFSFVVPANAFSDPDGDALTYSASGMPAWLAFDSATRTFSGTPPTGSSGMLGLTVLASDGQASVSDTFNVAIAAPNQPPIVASPIVDQTVTIGTAFNFTVPDGTFTDPNGDSLTYSASGMPAWLSFNAVTRAFTGTAPTAPEASTVTVTASDGQLMASDAFNIAVSDVVSPPQQVACEQGDPIPPRAALIMPPAVPQGGVVGVIVQNTGTTSATYTTFGQVFKSGDLMPSDGLVARFKGADHPAQMDVQALHKNGSVKLASVTVPSACAGTQLPITLAKAAPPTGAPVAIGTVPLTVDLTFTQGGTSQTIDLGAALAQAAPDFWLKGPLATQTRVDVLVPGSQALHLTADVTRDKSDRVIADVQFNRDLTKVVTPVDPKWPSRLTSLPALVYSATITLGDRQVTRDIKQHFQYTGWHEIIGAPSVNVQRDVAYLEATGAILPYNMTAGVYDSVIASYTSPNWRGSYLSPPFGSLKNPAIGEPFSTNGIAQGMAATGGRPDIGPTTMWNAIWLVTQDARAARMSLLQGDTARAIPWNYKNEATGRWVTPADHWAVYVSKNGSDKATIANYPDESNTGWGLNTAHQPQLTYVPYLMTAERGRYDLLMADAAKSMTMSWYASRCGWTYGYRNGDVHNDLVLFLGPYVRDEAWNILKLMSAAYLAKQESWYEGYYNQAVENNWKFVNTQQEDIPSDGTPAPGRLSASLEGELKGHFGGYAYDLPNGDKRVAAFMMDYTFNAAAAGAFMGYQGAKDFLGFAKEGFLTGRYLDIGMRIVDADEISIPAWKGATQQNMKTWAEVQASLVANGIVDPSQFVRSDYVNYTLSALRSTLYLFPGDARLLGAISNIEANVDPNPQTVANNVEHFRNDPTWSAR